MAFCTRDKLYGLHFTVALPHRLQCSPPLTAYFRPVDENNCDNLCFPAYPLEKTNSFEVCAQLPYATRNSSLVIVIHICDSLHNTVVHTAIPYDWICRQRKQLRMKKTEPLDIPINGHLTDQGQIVLRRIGSLVARQPVETVSLTRYAEEEVSLIEYWLSLNTPPCSNVPLILSGVSPCPIYIILLMADCLDAQSFDFSGRLPFTEEDVMIPKWTHDLLLTGKIVTRLQHNCSIHRMIWSMADHMTANISSGTRGDSSQRLFTYPQTNMVNRNTSDIVACRLTFVDVLYHAFFKRDSLSFVGDVPTDVFSSSSGIFNDCKRLMDSHWPCFVIARETDGESYIPLSGFGKRTALNEMIIHNGRTIESGDIMLMHPPQVAPSDIGQACFMVWRDYREEVLSMCLVQKKFDVGHSEFSVQKELGSDICYYASQGLFQFEEQDIFCKSFIRTVCQARSVCGKVRQLNAPSILRPILNTIQALNEVYVNERKTLNWHRGWVSLIASSWECKHRTTLFDAVRQINA